MSSKRGLAGIVLVMCTLSLSFTAATAATTMVSTESAWIDASVPLQNKGTDSTVRVRASGPVRRSTVQFDLSNIPGCAPIISADLQLVLTAKSSVSRIYNAHRLTESWIEGTSSANGVSWNLRDGVT